MGDDVPHVTCDFKFNVDHLAHEYAKLNLDMADDQKTEGAIKHVASTTEKLPFSDGYADIVFSRNSLDHLNNPLQTMIEINRVLKPKGQFFLSVYYNSNFIDCCETTIIDEAFLNNHIKRIFDVDWIELVPPEAEHGHQSEKFVLPQGRQLMWLHAVCRKKPSYPLYDSKDLEEYGKLTSDFHTALYYDEILKPQEAAVHYQKVLERKPFLETDNMRILYSKIRYLSINNHEEFRSFFDGFKQENMDPFWWKIVVLSSAEFMGKELKNEISLKFRGEEQVYLLHALKVTSELNFKRYVKNRKTLYKIARPFYRMLKRVFKKGDFFERTTF